MITVACARAVVIVKAPSSSVVVCAVNVTGGELEHETTATSAHPATAAILALRLMCPAAQPKKTSASA